MAENNTFYRKLAAIQDGVKAPKDLNNAFAGFYYRNAEQILQVAKPLCAAQGFFISCTDKLVFVEGRFYIEATASITDGTHVATATSYGREQESKKGCDPSQVTGMASSYARKYALCGLLALSGEADADERDNRGEGNYNNQNNGGYQQQPQQNNTSSGKSLEEAIRVTSKRLAAFKQKAGGITSIDELQKIYGLCMQFAKGTGLSQQIAAVKDQCKNRINQANNNGNK